MAIPIFQPQDNPTRANFNARIEQANAELAEKQDELTGTQGQVVGFNAAGKPVAQGTESLIGPPGADGAPGSDGKSAYQYAVDGGYTGTEAEFEALMGSGPWLPTSGGTLNGVVQAQKDIILGVDSTLGLFSPSNKRSAVIFSASESTIDFFDLILRGNIIRLKSKTSGGQIRITGVKTPDFSSDAANKQYVDDAIALLKQYVDDAIASIGPTGPSGAFAFSVSDNGHLICSYTGDSPPEFQISNDGHLIYSYSGGNSPGYYINENGHLCLDIEEGT